MNIIVSLYGVPGQWCFRPDTTLEKGDYDYYLPDGISSVSYSPILFVRISRAGKAIGAGFAERYYDAGGYGLLLYADTLSGLSPAGFAMASSLDKTSLLPFPLYGKAALSNKDNRFSVMMNGGCVFEGCPGTDMIPETLHGISSSVSLRTGDLVAVELDARRNAQAGDRLDGTLNGQSIFSLRLK